MKIPNLFKRVDILVCMALPLALSACGGGSSSSSSSGGSGNSGAVQPSLVKSTIAATPGTVIADGQTAADITVTLRDDKGHVIKNSPAPVKVDAQPCSSCTLKYANDNGEITGTITSTKVEAITLSFSVNGKDSSNTANVNFVSTAPSAAQSTISISNPGATSQGALAHGTRGGTAPAGVADGVTPLIATVTLYDAAGNRVTHGGNTVNISSSIGAVGPVKDRGNGTYTAQVVSIAPGNATAGFSLDGTNSPNTASVSFVTPSSTAGSAYLLPYTVSCYGACPGTGIYFVDSANPSQSAVQVATGVMMGDGTFSAYAAIKKEVYDPATSQVQFRGLSTLIYAMNNEIFSLDLTSGTSPSPQRLSTLAPTVVCSIHLISEPSYWVEITGFTGANATTSDCQNKVPDAWLVPRNGNASSQPVAIDAYLGSLIDPQTGKVEGLLIRSAADLDLYSANLATHSTLAKGIFPAGSTAANLGKGLDSSAVIDVGTIANGIRTDQIYRVDETGANAIASLNFSTSNPYFSNSSNLNCYAMNNNFSPQNYIPSSVLDSNRTLYFTYPTSTGFALETLATGSDTLQTIYEQGSDYGDCGLDGASQSLVTLDESGNLSTDGPRVISVSNQGPANQSPLVLVSDNSYSWVISWAYSAAGNNFWVSDWHCSDSSCTTPTFSMTAISPDGSSSHTFPNTMFAGGATDGFNAKSGQIFSKFKALTPAVANGTCKGTGWVLYDSATLNAIATPDFGSGACVNWDDLDGLGDGAYLGGINSGLLLGSVSDAANTTDADAFGLFDAAGSPQLVDFGHYRSTSGETFIRPLYY